MNIKTITPKINTLEAFQIDHDNMVEVVDYLNNNFGIDNTYDLMADNGIYWIGRDGGNNVHDEVIVAGDWAVMNFGRVWFMSNADFNKDYKVKR